MKLTTQLHFWMITLFISSSLHATKTHLNPTSGKQQTVYLSNEIMMENGYLSVFPISEKARFIEYLPGFTDLDISNRVLNTALPFGRTQGTQEVSPNGSANYSFPIVTPPGTKALQPQLSISYNSLSGNGSLGRGWHIAGLSAISRGNKSIYYDTQIQEAKHNKNDAYFLNGNRLMHLTGSYGQGGSEYGTADEDFSTISGVGSNSTSPAWFKVETKEGLTYEYGNSVTSVLYHSDGTKLSWMLSKISDCNGNYIEFVYIDLGDELLIDEVNYTGNAAAGLNPYNTIKFHYASRNDPNTVYRKGHGINQNHLLQEIEITGEGGLAFKQYQFNYSNSDDGHSLLREIREFGTNGASLNTTMLKYGAEPPRADIDLSGLVFNEDKDLIPGDFDGDGYTDILAAGYSYYGNIKVHDKIDLYRKNPTSTNFNLIYSNNSFVSSISKKANNFSDFRTADFNGDGLDDILTFKHTVQGNWNYLSEIRTNVSNGAGFDMLPVVPSTGAFNCIPSNLNFIQVGDFNGDGKSDFITLLGNCVGNANPDYRAYLSFSGGDDPNHIIDDNISGYPQTSWADADEIIVVDFNGDGKSDLMVIDDMTTTVYSIKKNGNFYNTEVLHTGGYPTQYHKMFFGDFNGDGKTDLLTQANGTWNVGFSTGTNFNVQVFSSPIPLSTNFIDQTIQVLDINGDGMSDIAVSSNTQHGTTDVEAILSTGMGFKYQFIENMSAHHIPLDPRVVFGDYNGDGRSDILLTQENNMQIQQRIIYFKPNGTERLLEKVSDGYAFVTEFQYRSLTKGGNLGDYYNKGGASAYPNIKVTPPIYTVEKMILPDGIGGQRNFIYSYEGAILNREGKGLLGFDKFSSIDDQRGFKETMEFELDLNYRHMVLRKNITKKFPSSALISETDYTSQLDFLSPKRFWLRISNITTKDYVNNHRNKVDLQYDAYGNVTRRETKKGLPIGGSGQAHEITVENYDNFTATCTGIPALPQDVIVGTVVHGGAPVEKETKYYYNSVYGLYKTIEFYGTNEPITTEFTAFHPDFGNVTAKQILTPGYPTKTESYGFDPKGRFVTSKTNTLGQTENQTFDPLWGVLNSVTSIDGLQTEYTYDAFGRLASTTDYLGHTQTYSWHWDLQAGNGSGSTSVSNALYHTEADIPGFPNEEVYYDIYDRKRESRHVGFNGQWIKNITSYDALGRVNTTTTPFDNPADAIVTQYSYDEFDRITAQSDPASNTSYIYNTSGTYNEKEVNLPNGNTTITKTDAAGRIMSSIDNGGTLGYTYDSFGNITTVSLDGSVISTMSYDPVYGRQTSLTDVNAGTTNYQYNAYGQLVSQTDGNGNTRTFTYDAAGKILNEAGPEGTTSYQYVSAGNGLNQIEKMIGFNGLTKEYTYDSYNRLENLTVPFLSNLTVTHWYGTYGRLVDQVYSTGVRIMHIMDANGYVTKVQSVEDNGQQSVLTDLFEAQDMNAFGLYTQYLAGNGVSSNITYNNYGRPTFYNAGNGSVQYLQLDWDNATGNLDQRTDHVKSKSETFVYDSMDRLKNATIQGGATNITQFNPDGSIFWNHDVEFMEYHSGPDNSRVKKIENPAIDISLQKQQISYTAFDKPDVITESVFEQKFNYGPSKTRMQSILKENGVISWVREYLPEVGYESILENGVKKHLHYVPFGDKLGVIIMRCEGESGGELPGGGNGEQPIGDGSCASQYDYFYTYTDHLGSILTLTDAGGQVVGEQNFDAWGRYRDPNSWNYVSTASTAPDWLIRGYTGHEKLDNFELIHMNGRLYAPKTIQMINPDNFVQNPFNTQNYNRYTYALNNPLKYVDPSGEFLTWSVGNTGFSIGVNLTPIGVPLGIGYNFGYGDGFSAGIYGEVGYKVGGTGFGAGAVVSQSLDYNFKHETLSTTSSASAFVSYGPAKVGGSLYINHDITNNQTKKLGWSVYGGIGVGNEKGGVGLYVGYGSRGWTYGLNGYYDPRSKEPKYSMAPDENGDINHDHGKRIGNPDPAELQSPATPSYLKNGVRLEGGNPVTTNVLPNSNSSQFAFTALDRSSPAPNSGYYKPYPTSIPHKSMLYKFKKK